MPWTCPCRPSRSVAAPRSSARLLLSRGTRRGNGVPEAPAASARVRSRMRRPAAAPFQSYLFCSHLQVDFPFLFTAKSRIPRKWLTQDVEGDAPTARFTATASCRSENGFGRNATPSASDRKSVVYGKSVSVRVDLGGRRNIKKKKQYRKTDTEKNT